MEWWDYSSIHDGQDESNACDVLTAKAQRRQGAEERIKKSFFRRDQLERKGS